jgi:hypothetical protein
MAAIRAEFGHKLNYSVAATIAGATVIVELPTLMAGVVVVLAMADARLLLIARQNVTKHLRARVLLGKLH